LIWQAKFNLLGVLISLFFWRKIEYGALVASQVLLVVISLIQKNLSEP